MTAQRRKSVLINPKFQLGFVAYVTATSLFVATFFLAATEFFFFKMRAQGLGAGLPPNHIFFRFIHEQHRLMLEVFLGAAILSLILQVVSGILLSHRVAGPLYRLQRYFETKTSAGEAQPLDFRKGDFFPEIPEAINRYFARQRESEKRKAG